MIFRVARHTSNLDSIVQFYRHYLSLDVLGDFMKHENYDGVFLGKEGENWHLEFTVSNEEPLHIFDDDDLLVFYPTTQHEFDMLKSKIQEDRLPVLTSKNPYWNQNGITISDPDGHRVVICPLKCK